MMSDQGDHIVTVLIKQIVTCDHHFKLQICDSQLLTGDHNLENC